MVVKPAPTTPLTTLRLGELIKDMLPPGVLNVIADANDLGGALTAHPDVRKISFTGSTATGKKVMASAAQTFKRITLELGGNDAGIVLDDVDPKKVAPGIFQGAFQNTGQVCIAMKRVYVHESIYDAMCNELAALAESTVVGDGLKQGTQLGPLQNKMQYEKVKEFLADARKHGKVIAGGAAMDKPGYFIKPTIVRDINDGSRLVDEEQFGPVLPVIKYTDTEDAIAAPTPRPTAWAVRCGRPTPSGPTRSPAGSRPARCGSTSTSTWRRTSRSAAPSSRASARNSAKKASPNSRSCRSSTDRGLWPDYRLGSRRRRRDPVSFSCQSSPMNGGGHVRCPMRPCRPCL